MAYLFSAMISCHLRRGRIGRLLRRLLPDEDPLEFDDDRFLHLEPAGDGRHRTAVGLGLDEDGLLRVVPGRQFEGLLVGRRAIHHLRHRRGLGQPQQKCLGAIRVGRADRHCPSSSRRPG